MNNIQLIEIEAAHETKVVIDLSRLETCELSAKNLHLEIAGRVKSINFTDKPSAATAYIKITKQWALYKTTLQ